MVDLTSSSQIQLYTNEFIGHTTINRGFLRLYNNDVLLDAAIDSTSAALQSEIDGLDVRLQVVEATDNSENINYLSGEIDLNSADITYLSGQVDVNTASIVANDADIAYLSGQIGPSLSGITVANLMYIEDLKTSGTQGGTSVAGTWNVRDLTTASINNIAGASLSSNQITLPAGSYWCQFSAPHLTQSSTQSVHQLRVRDIDNSITLAIGENAESGAGLGVDIQTTAIGDGYFTLSGETTIELQHYTSTGRVNVGLGWNVSSGEVEKYARIKIWRIS